MKPTLGATSLFGIAAAVVLTICLAAQHATRVGLVEARSTLQEQLNQMTELAACNEQLSNALSRANSLQLLPEDQSRELMRLRGQAAALRRQVAGIENVRAENRTAHAALESNANPPDAPAPNAIATADYWPQGSWAFKGYASPEAALQSSLFAANNGDLKGMLAAAAGDLQKRLEEDFAAKSENEASIQAMNEVMSVKSVRILDREFQDNETVVLTADFEDRTETHAGRLIMKKVGNDWKLAGVAK